LIARKLSLEVNIPYAYKFCDFKPAYGEIFNDYLNNYDFWGCCDIDMLFGDLSKFITPALLANHKKIFSRGHLMLFKNEPAVNSAYRSSKLFDYKTILESPSYWFFDEWHGVHVIFEELGLGQHDEDVMGDIKVLSSRLDCTNIPNYHPQIFAWEQGDVKQYYIQAGQLTFTELAYIHFQKRKIALPDPAVYTSKTIILNPRALRPFNNPITKAVVKEYDRVDYRHYIASQIKRVRNSLASLNKQAQSFNKSAIRTWTPAK